MNHQCQRDAIGGTAGGQDASANGTGGSGGSAGTSGQGGSGGPDVAGSRGAGGAAGVVGGTGGTGGAAGSAGGSSGTGAGAAGIGGGTSGAGGPRDGGDGGPDAFGGHAGTPSLDAALSDGPAPDRAATDSGRDSDGPGGNDDAGGDGPLDTATGALMPFGGQDETCLAAVDGGLQVAACGDNNDAFTFMGSAIRTSAGLCVEVHGGDLTAGVVDVATCNGDASQQWMIMGGQITPLNQSDSQMYCLDVYFGDHSVGTPVDLAPCNGTAAQVFWPTGYRIALQSAFVDANTNTPECLDLYFDSEQAGTPFDSSDCNASNAQIFVLDTSRRIHMANDPSLCVAISGSASDGVAEVTLVSCSDNLITAPQQWYFSATSQQGGVNVVNQSMIDCLDIFGGNQAPATQIDSYMCNGTPAQLWYPELAP